MATAKNPGSPAQGKCPAPGRSRNVTRGSSSAQAPTARGGSPAFSSPVSRGADPRKRASSVRAAGGIQRYRRRPRGRRIKRCRRRRRGRRIQRDRLDGGTRRRELSRSGERTRSFPSCSMNRRFRGTRTSARKLTRRGERHERPHSHDFVTGRRDAYRFRLPTGEGRRRPGRGQRVRLTPAPGADLAHGAESPAPRLGAGHQRRPARGGRHRPVADRRPQGRPRPGHRPEPGASAGPHTRPCLLYTSRSAAERSSSPPWPAEAAPPEPARPERSRARAPPELRPRRPATPGAGADPGARVREGSAYVVRRGHAAVRDGDDVGRPPARAPGASPHPCPRMLVLLGGEGDRCVRRGPTGSGTAEAAPTGSGPNFRCEGAGSRAGR